ncbi:tetratricopeptide repeat protein [Bacillus atrophaeus]|uniref:tetratricopeptide repeat protein n=1 Tax=Bacillus atrophaeus TaxID=1452 RepID=UPI00227E7BB8|nr:tetratricopeptide repeat protein [Bacillus atrophaeus]MCY8914496.1 tetratricopeptide repeat protein [Bacillus atrophaeus]MCY9116462.1 tetratricopeptide repeat protein [Bacillus atrophaeus]MEC0927529.1 tetratricopeptide repeat protein [Bacillus atrophaeus]MEC0934801.1 tetratricopeptide repeat protein [Bacillus atrophaeus]
MAELEDQKQFAELLAPGVKSLKLHPDYKIKRKKNEKTGQSYLDNIAHQLGVSPNTIKSWIGQMGVNYVPGRIDDGKLFGMIWIILEKTDMNIEWFTDLLETTTIPVIKPALPVWAASCLKKAKTLRKDGSFGSPLDEDIEKTVKRLFPEVPDHKTNTLTEQIPLTHNLPSRWSGHFIGRRFDIEAIRQWMISASPACLITGWAGMGKTTTALEAAYSCIGDSSDWPAFNSIIWLSADWKGLSFSDFLNTIAYQLGRTEQIDKSINEKRFVVRNALANYTREKPVLLIVDSIDTAERDIHEFITSLPQGVKVLLTARENLKQTYREGFGETVTIQLSGLEKTDALKYFHQEVNRCLQMCNDQTKQAKLAQLLELSPELKSEFISATAGNPKAMALSIAYMSDDDIPAQQLIHELGKAGYSLLDLFDFLFGRTWHRCNEDTRKLWQVLCFFSKPPDENSLSAAAGLDARRFHYAVEQMRSYALIQPERSKGRTQYLVHQTVVAYGEQHLSENQDFENEARRRWAQYYIRYLETHLKREQPISIYWSYLLGRDLDQIKKEWPNILKVIKWSSETGQKEILIEQITRISHFLSRINLPLRIEYGCKAAEYANQLGKYTLEAFFRMDTAGWALMEVNDFDGALQQIEAGLKILEQSDSADHDVHDLKVWGLALQSRLFLKAGHHEKAEAILNEIKDQPISPTIQHRVLLVRGDLSFVRGYDEEAIQLYEAANEISSTYGGEKTIEAYFNLGVAYVKCGQFEKAEEAFEQMLYDKHNANQVELIYYYYGMAQLLYRKGEKTKAMDSNQKAIRLIDSWEPAIGIRGEVERLDMVIGGYNENTF